MLTHIGQDNLFGGGFQGIYLLAVFCSSYRNSLYQDIGFRQILGGYALLF
jgi:hypothetical protein